ncbi:MAG: hypothetical protein DME25_18555 [Verrucomicrobia bacterium]|nr:MAG: hypothetical protein DME25_18555 [Verrucomicrobiota bacterium]
MARDARRAHPHRQRGRHQSLPRRQRKQQHPRRAPHRLRPQLRHQLRRQRSRHIRRRRLLERQHQYLLRHQRNRHRPNTSAVSNPAPQAVYQTERWGSSTYTFPNLMPVTNYTLRLHFAEISPSVTTNGNRLFNISINGTQVLTNFDIFAAAGGKFRAITRQFVTYPDNSGQIFIQFTKGPSNEAKVGGIELFATPPLPPPRISAAISTNGAVTLTWPTYPGKTYRVQFKNALADTNWNTLNPDVTAVSESASKSDASAVGQRFYRLLVLN